MYQPFYAGLEALGVDPFVEEKEFRLWSLNAVKVPEGVSDARVRQLLLSDYGIEIGGGLGPLKGQVWRIGLMGESSTRDNVILLLAALAETLHLEGLSVERDSGTSAAGDVYAMAR